MNSLPPKAADRFLPLFFFALLALVAVSLAAAGPMPKRYVCDAELRSWVVLAREELGVDLSLNAVYDTLRRLGYSCLAPRPRHEKQDLEAQKKFKEENAPFL